MAKHSPRPGRPPAMGGNLPHADSPSPFHADSSSPSYASSSPSSVGSPSPFHADSSSPSSAGLGAFAVELMEGELAKARAGTIDTGDPALDAQWVRASGVTPLEFLCTAYRNPAVRMTDRISAAKQVLDFAHKRLPQSLTLQGDPVAPLLGRLGPASLEALSDEELDVFRKILEKMNASGS